MTHLPITLSLSPAAMGQVKKQGRDGTIPARAVFDPNADEDTRKRIFARDNNTCQYCGFQSEKFQLVHKLPKSGLKAKGPSVSSDDAMVTSCVFCHQCFHLDEIGDMKSGVLIWMPELTQAQLHHLARAVYVGRIAQGPMAEASRKVLELIMQRREEVIERIKTDDPQILSLILRDYLSKQQYDERIEKLDGVRLFPLDRRLVKVGDSPAFNQFPQILAYWRSKDGPFAHMNPTQWLNHYKTLTTQQAA